MTLARELFAFDFAAVKIAASSTLAHELHALAFDRLSTRTFDMDRRLHVEVCNISKSTVNPYYGREIPNGEALGLNPDKIYNLYRDPSELAKAAPTFARLQLLDLHTGVDADDPKLEHTCGTVGSDVRFEHPYLKASLAVWTSKAINNILRLHTAQLSCSYRYRADMTPGVSPEGLAFDGVMRDIVGNHVALVKAGRAGPDVYVNDELPLGLNMKYPKILSVIAAVIPTLTEAQKLALDAAMDAKAKEEDCDAEGAMDEREAAMDEREAAMDATAADAEQAKDRKAARDARKTARDARAFDRKAAADAKRVAGDTDPKLAAKEKEMKGEDSAAVLEAALASGKVITADAAKKLAEDAATAAVARQNELTQAYKDVAPLVGAVTTAMDSAESVYRFALDSAKVEHKNVHASALSALVSAEVRVRKSVPKPAFDSVSTDYSIDSIFSPVAG